MSERKTIFEAGRINNFWTEDEVLSSVDLIAVKNGIKKVTRREIFDGSDEGRYQKICARHGLSFSISDQKLFEHHNIYISRDKKLAVKAKDYDPSFKILIEKKEFGEVLKEIKEFSRLLNYPDCCIERYIKNVMDGVGVEQSDNFRKTPPRINFLLNSILSGVSNHYLSFHLPCSFLCQNTRDYQRRILACVKKDSPDFYQELVFNLARPFLVFLDPSRPNLYVSWDSRRGFIFEGKASRGEISYGGCLYFEANYVEFEGRRETEKETDLIKERIRSGNRITFKKDAFSVWRGGKRVFVWRNRKDLAAYFLNFIRPAGY